MSQAGDDLSTQAQLQGSLVQSIPSSGIRLTLSIDGQASSRTYNGSGIVGFPCGRSHRVPFVAKLDEYESRLHLRPGQMNRLSQPVRPYPGSPA